jgi:hypothetical protein
LILMLTSSRSSLTSDQLDDLQSFLKDWLRHTGRTQADLRRALQASSIRMPVLLEELNRTYSRSGLDGLAQQLCGIEELWQHEDGWPAGGVNPLQALGASAWMIPWGSWICFWRKFAWIRPPNPQIQAKWQERPIPPCVCVPC